MYITHSEWAASHGAKAKSRSSEFKRLPFSCCALSLLPFELPVCAPDGTIFDLLNIIPFIKKNKVHPVTGQPLEASDLVTLQFDKNKDGMYQCPVTFKTFTDNTHIVAIRTTGNVYSFGAVDTLCIKPSNYRDLLTDEKFTKKDIIVLQDPHKLQARNINSFHFVTQNIAVEAPIAKDSLDLALPTKDLVASLGKVIASAPVAQAKKIVPPKSLTAAHFSNGLTAASLTSTRMNVLTKTVSAVLDQETLLFQSVKQNSYVTLHTTLGVLNLELSYESPRTSFNFLQLARKGYYDGTKFHRSIRGFMIQGGDPTGTGSGGESCWGPAFKDEFRPMLKHNCRGILSMANKGVNTNTSQFFLTYKAQAQLDGKHVVFGKLVGGSATLDACEKVGTNEKDEPLLTIEIARVEIVVDAFQAIVDDFDNSEARKIEIAEKKDKAVCI